MLNLVPHPSKIEAEARRIAARLLQRQGAETAPGDWETVDIASAADSDTRSLGIEHAALAALDMLGLPDLLDDLGFNRWQRCCALATIAARMAAPGSERAANRWLRRTSALGELLGIDWDADTMWKTYIPLTDAEAVFRALKSELGLRPIFHQKEHRADGHLFIPVLAYQAVQVLRTPMKKAGYHDNWTSLRRILRTLQRTMLIRPPSTRPWASHLRTETSTRP